MKRAIGHTMVATAVLAAVVFLAAPAAQAQVRFEGRFRLPHGRIAIGVGDPYYPGYYGGPYFPVGSYVPYGYRVIRVPRYGYGFYNRSYWVPVRRYRTRWVVIAQPVLVERPYYDRGYRGDPYYDFNREYWDRSYRNPYPNPYDR
jgi:hypothetical protein